MDSRRPLAVLLPFLLFVACRVDPVVAPPQRSAPGDLSLNLDYEELAADYPLEWYLAPGSERATVRVTDTVAHSGLRSLYFRTNASDGEARSYCLNSLVADIARDSIELTVYVRQGSGGPVTFGFFYQSERLDTTTAPVYTELPPEVPPQSDWRPYRTVIPVDSLRGELFNFGFWVSGNGELWADDWRVAIDGKDYRAATEASFPPPSREAVDHLARALVPLAPTAPYLNGEGCKRLLDRVGAVRIVLLGEGTHGTAEFVTLRRELTDCLLREGKFSVVALEANPPETNRLYDLLTAGATGRELREGIDGLHFWMYRTREFLLFAEWLGAYRRADGTGVTLSGIDMQYAELPLRELTDFAAAVADSALLNLLGGIRTEAGAAAVSVARAEAVVAYLDAHPPASGASDPKYADALVNARVVAAALRLRYTPVPQYFRDARMADNVRYLLGRPPAEKIIVWAHNEHVRRDARGMGQWLVDSLGPDRVISIGLTTGGGRYRAIDYRDGSLGTHDLKSPTPDSWEYYLRAAGAPNSLLDLRGADFLAVAPPYRRLRSLGGLATPKQFFPADLRRKFDLLVYLDSTTATTPY